MVQGKFTVGSDGAINDSGQVVEAGFRVGEIEFKLGERSTLRTLVFPGVVALLRLGVIYLFYRTRVGT